MVLFFIFTLVNVELNYSYCWIHLFLWPVIHSVVKPVRTVQVIGILIIQFNLKLNVKRLLRNSSIIIAKSNDFFLNRRWWDSLNKESCARHVTYGHHMVSKYCQVFFSAKILVFNQHLSCQTVNTHKRNFANIFDVSMTQWPICSKSCVMDSRAVVKHAIFDSFQPAVRISNV